MTAQLNGRWDAAAFFESLTTTNRLAQAEGFTFCRVSGLDGFEEAVNQMQSASAFVCVSDIADGTRRRLHGAEQYAAHPPRQNGVFRYAPCRRGHGGSLRVHGNNA